MLEHPKEKKSPTSESRWSNIATTRTCEKTITVILHGRGKGRPTTGNITEVSRQKQHGGSPGEKSWIKMASCRKDSARDNATANLTKIPAGGTQRAQRRNKTNRDTPSPNKPQDKCEEGLNKYGNSDEGSQKEKKDILPHEEDNHAQATPCLSPVLDGYYYRETVRYWAD